MQVCFHLPGFFKQINIYQIDIITKTFKQGQLSPLNEMTITNHTATTKFCQKHLHCVFQNQGQTAFFLLK